MSNKIYWKGLDELAQDPEFVARAQNEFAEDLPVQDFLGNEDLDKSSTTRRDFLKFLGFSVTAAAVAACETPVEKSIPYLVKPENIIPGIPNYFATTFYDENDFATVLVKTREGRPIKIEPNTNALGGFGGTSARVQASVLSLYDTKRPKDALKSGEKISWSTADLEIVEKLGQIQEMEKKTVLLTSSIVSPSAQSAINKLKEKYSSVEHITFDAISYNAIRKANAASFGKAVIPSYHFNKAKAIVSFGADFLGTWLSSNLFTKQFAETRNPENGEMSRLFQFETTLSLTGTNADYRTAVKTSEIGEAVLALHNYIKGGSAGSESFSDEIARAGDFLKKNKGKSLVVCGINDANLQFLVNEINTALDNYGKTIDLENELNIKQGDDASVAKLFDRIKKNEVKGLIVWNSNPVYYLSNGVEFANAISSLVLSVSISDRLDETAEYTEYVCPGHHYLESWNDFNPSRGIISITQPTIHPLYNTRQSEESLLVWAGLAKREGKNSSAYREFIKEFWSQNLFSKQSKYITFSDFWNFTLHDGVVEIEGYNFFEVPTVETGSITVASASAAAKKRAEGAGSWELELYQKVGIGSGTQSYNPWLQELPDPISKATWDNYITMSPADMKDQGFNTKNGQNEQSNVVELNINGVTLELPVFAQPGQKRGTIGLALGYGRKFGKSDEIIGTNAYPLVSFVNGNFSYSNNNITFNKTEKTYQVACTQTHHTMMGRAIVKETSLGEFKADPRSGNVKVTFHTNLKSINGEEIHDGHATSDQMNYWKTFDKINHRWGLSIDLSTCFGCSACVVACHSENNVPVVGKDEVRRARDMHWMRIDRYYTSDADPANRYDKYQSGFDRTTMKAMEEPSENPRVVHQPVMCQHCNQAPCETVCPVLATTHSNEGLNQMTYNRCIGTRYCANNCPYKVRRFNWFKYFDNDKFDFYMNDDLGKMVLNPDVTVRSRGVMEKCSMCVQRIQYGKLEAKKQSRRPVDGEIKTACAQACPTNAITFGDYNDKVSKIANLEKAPRAYHLLDEIGTQPSVIYQVKVRNIEEEYGHEVEAHHGGGHHDSAHDDNHGAH
jgi:molybdopterin-containing oxidoreductase family iron-sulfur binding subunit